MTIELKPFVLLALNLEPSNDLPSKELTVIKQAFDDTIFKHCRGSYKGVQENSYLIPINHKNDATKIDATKLSKCIELANTYSQETILIVDSKRQASLLGVTDNYRDNSVEFLGEFKQVSKTFAIDSDAWTLDIDTGKYWTVI